MPYISIVVRTDFNHVVWTKTEHVELTDEAAKSVGIALYDGIDDEVKYQIEGQAEHDTERGDE